MAADARGIDVSNFSGQFNWAATSGLSFGICRASQGLGATGTNSPDPFLTWNWPRIKAKGLARGAYHFLDPRLSGAQQASYFVETVSKAGLETTDMLWLDNEAPGVEVQSGQLNNGANAITVISVPFGSGTNIAFGCDNGLQGLPPAALRVAVYDTQWHITSSVTVDSAKGQAQVRFPNPKKTGVISVKRMDAGDVVVGYEVS